MSSSHGSGEIRRAPRIGGYEVLVRLGKGGMASVYLVCEPGDPTQLYALKLLHPHLANQSEFVDMLTDEARIASLLNHPNIVSSRELGVEQDRHYLIMDYVEGVALDRLLQVSGPAHVAHVISAAIGGLRGLHAAHQLKDQVGQPLELVHRDVTPGNLIVGVNGVTRIADFGVAKARARLTKTNPGIVKGKAGYISPEVILGREVDGRADVFSMGVLLWNALTGEKLFDQDDMVSTLTTLLKQDPVPPSTVGHRPPAVFDEAILKALKRDPSSRYETALEMAEALEQALLNLGTPLNEQATGEWVQQCFSQQLHKRKEMAQMAAQVRGPVTPMPESAPPSVLDSASTGNQAWESGVRSVDPQAPATMHEGRAPAYLSSIPDASWQPSGGAPTHAPDMAPESKRRDDTTVPRTEIQHNPLLHQSVPPESGSPDTHDTAIMALGSGSIPPPAAAPVVSADPGEQKADPLLDDLNSGTRRHKFIIAVLLVLLVGAGAMISLLLLLR